VPVCHSCRGLLDHRASRVPIGQEVEAAISDTYRAALKGAAPDFRVWGRITDAQFRRFVHDMLELLELCLPPSSMHGGGEPVRREEFLTVVARLILDGVPAMRARQRRYHPRRVLPWIGLLSFLDDVHGKWLLEMSVAWPAHLQARLHSALHRAKRRRWPYSPFSLKKTSNLRERYAFLRRTYEIASPTSRAATALRPVYDSSDKMAPPVYDLSDRKQGERSQSTI